MHLFSRSLRTSTHTTPFFLCEQRRAHRERCQSIVLRARPVRLAPLGTIPLLPDAHSAG